MSSSRCSLLVTPSVNAHIAIESRMLLNATHATAKTAVFGRPRIALWGKRRKLIGRFELISRNHK